MKLPDSHALAQIVTPLARELLLPCFNRISHSLKQDGSLVTEADIAMQEAVQASLAEAWPDIAMVGEEMPKSAQEAVLANPGQTFWCLDPLDGTTNFASGCPLFAVSLALVAHRKVVSALTYDPLRDEVFRADRDEGAWLNDEPLPLNDRARERECRLALLDLKRLPRRTATALMSSRLFGSQRNLGSCVMEWAWLAAGRADVYLHGGQKLWDYAAGTLLLREAGGNSVFLDHNRAFHPHLPPRPALGSLNRKTLETWRAWLAHR